tara:strand:+ start:239 stop:538 length:300 start_codon:yes stop_codon:yes gene_type:complete
MSDKVDLLKYRTITVPVEYEVKLDDSDSVYVLKDGKPVTIENLTGKNVYDLDPRVSFDDIIHEYETRNGSMAPASIMGGIKRGTMYLVSSLTGKNKSKL